LQGAPTNFTYPQAKFLSEALDMLTAWCKTYLIPILFISMRWTIDILKYLFQIPWHKPKYCRV